MTDPEGDFSFAPKLGEGEIYAASTAGFARGRAADLVANGQIMLRAWASVRGRLVEKGKPLANEHVQLELRVNPLSQRLWFYLPSTCTDDEGQFFIDCVPAGDLQISTRSPIERGTTFTMQSQRRFNARPGQ